VNRIVPSALAAAAIALLSGCAADATQPRQPTDKYLDASYTPTGTLIPRKASNSADNVVVVDKQALENDRTNNNGTNNWAGGSH
jgi:hypothetical protein